MNDLRLSISVEGLGSIFEPAVAYLKLVGSAREYSRAVLSKEFMAAFTRVRSIANLLRLAAISVILSGVTFFLPETWIDSFLVWCGLGQMPHAALMRYVLRGAGFLQVAGGVAIWVIAGDVVRYRPIVITVLANFLVGAPAFYLIDAIVGLPRWWCIMDFACCFLAGGVPLAFCLWPSKTSPGTALAPDATAP